MKALINRFSPAAVAVGAVLALGSTASAQGYNPKLFLVNPNPIIAPGVRLQQYAFNVSVMGRAYHQIPPYILGYNPYPLSVNYGPVFNPYGFRPQLYNPYSPAIYGNVVPTGVPYAGGYSPYVSGAPTNPYAYNPYAGGYGGGGGGGYSAAGVDPLSGISGGYTAGGGNYGAWNPYAGGYGYGSGQELLALGQVALNQEQARILREGANQAKLDTRKKYIDTMAYIRANDYNFTKEQADIADRLVKRVQKTPTAAEIQTGKSLNVLLDDLSKFEVLAQAQGKQSRSMSTVTLDEDVLKLVNITSPGSYGNIGLLRDSGRFNWPSAFDDKDVASDKERKDVELQTRELYEQAANAKPNNNTLKDLESALKGLRDKLSATKGLSPTNYLEGQRFLDNFDAAVVAIKKGDVVTNLEFQQKFNAKGGRTVQELVEYMGTRGLKFAPVNGGDERSYYALQAALAARSMAIHSEVAAAGKDN